MNHGAQTAFKRYFSLDMKRVMKKDHILTFMINSYSDHHPESKSLPLCISQPVRRDLGSQPPESKSSSFFEVLPQESFGEAQALSCYLWQRSKIYNWEYFMAKSKILRAWQSWSTCVYGSYRHVCKSPGALLPYGSELKQRCWTKQECSAHSCL